MSPWRRGRGEGRRSGSRWKGAGEGGRRLQSGGREEAEAREPLLRGARRQEGEEEEARIREGECSQEAEAEVPAGPL